MEFNYKQGEKLEVVQVVGDLKIGDIVTVKDDNHGSDSMSHTNVTRDSDGRYFAGCYAKRFKKVAPALDLTKPLRTKKGELVTIVTTEGRGEYPVIGYIGDNDSIDRFTKEGKYYASGTTSTYDLENVPPKPLERELYVNINKVNGSLNRGGTYDSRAHADRNAHTNRVGCMKITLVEGVFDD